MGRGADACVGIGSLDPKRSAEEISDMGCKEKLDRKEDLEVKGGELIWT